MIYIYDIMLNLNEELIEFFEWEEQDHITYVRRIPMCKISSIMMMNLLTNKVKITTEFLENIKNKSLINNQKGLEYLTLFTDEKIVVGVLLNNEGQIILLSRLIVDEEEEVLELASRLKEEKIEYKILNKNNSNILYLTRKEKQISKELEKEIYKLYEKNQIDKLNYFYYEYFNKISNNKDQVFQELLKSIKTSFNEKHLKLYEIIKLSYSHK